MVRGRLLALVVVTAVIGGAGPAGAATLTVTSGFDENIAGDGACSLREAVLAVDSPGSANGDCAPAAFGANTIVLGPQTYFLGGASAPAHGELQIAPTVTSLTIVGAGEGKTAIDGGQLGNRVFDVASGATLTLQS